MQTIWLILSKKKKNKTYCVEQRSPVRRRLKEQCKIFGKQGKRKKDQAEQSEWFGIGTTASSEAEWKDYISGAGRKTKIISKTEEKTSRLTK